MGCLSSKPVDPKGSKSESKQSSKKGQQQNQTGGGVKQSSGKGRESESKQGKGAVSHLIASNQNVKIQEKWEIQTKAIGKGSYGTVSIAYSLSDPSKTGKKRKTVAVKQIRKSQVRNTGRFLQEINIMKMLDHPNCVKLYETFEDHRSIYLVMELCSGGELFDRIVEAGNGFSERDAACIMQQILRGVFYMHQMQIVHRDLKPENFLFQTSEPIQDTALKIIDFGLSVKSENGQQLKTKAGTPYYVAPQVLAGKYNESCDVWSCGVICFVLLCGYPPFHGDTDADVLMKVRQGQFDFVAADWRAIKDNEGSPQNLIRGMLKMNVKDRFDAEQCLNHPWIKKCKKNSNTPIGNSMGNNISNFAKASKFKKKIIHCMAHNMKADHFKDLLDIFNQMDTNGDGSIDQEEWNRAFQSPEFNKQLKPGVKEQLIEAWKAVDADGSNCIEYTEFLAMATQQSKLMTEDNLWHAFSTFDKDGNGSIDNNELKLLLSGLDRMEDLKLDIYTKDKNLDKMVKECLTECDKDGNGTIDFLEFVEFMKTQEN